MALVDNIVLFGRLLRGAGLPLSPDQTRAFARATTWLDLGDRRQVFYAARALLVTRKEDLRLFEILFELFWTAHSKGTDLKLPRRNRLKNAAAPERRFDLYNLMAGRPGDDAPEVEVGDRSGSFSPGEVLQHKDFSELTEAELAEVRSHIREIRWRASRRETRRHIPDRRGRRLHLRKILRDAAKHDGVPFTLHRLERKIKDRPIVLLADISGSMDKYSRLLLHFFYGAVHGLREVEAFAFGTRLTRLTPHLKVRNIEVAIEQAAREVLDWSGGTRIGDSIAAFNRSWGRRVLRRGAVVVIVSDGWERGDATDLAREMRHLHRRCHRLIWLNPHLGHPGYQPLVEGMAAALPFVDDFLPVHNLRSLRDLAEALRSLPHRKGARRTVAGTG